MPCNVALCTTSYRKILLVLLGLTSWKQKWQAINSSVWKTKTVHLHKRFKAKRNISEQKKNKQIFLTCDNTSLFNSFPPFAILFLCLNLVIACQVASQVYTTSCKKFWVKISTKLFLPNLKVISGLNQTEFSLKIFLSVSYLVSNGPLVLFLHKLVLHSILRPISADTIRIYSTGRDRSKL